MKVILCVLCLCVTVCFGDECKKTEVDDDVFIESSRSCITDFQLKYPTYPIEVEVQELTLDSSDGSYLSFAPEHDEKVYKFVWAQEKPKKFIIEQSNMKITFYTTKTNNNFKIHLKRHGALTTTTSTTTAEPWPTPGDNDSIYYTGNIAVSTAEFTDNELAFKQALANMTEEYCLRENILLAENVTTNNIIIHLVIQCPPAWPSSHRCSQVTFAIPVVQASTAGYELRAQHLQRMWRDFAPRYLAWDVYEAPDSDHDLLVWLGVSLAVLAAVAGVLVAGRVGGGRIGGRNQVTFAIPVAQASTAGYELRAQHLQRMWRDFAPACLAWGVYEAPDSGHDLLVWLGVSLAVLAAVAGVLGAGRVVGGRIGGRKKRRASDMEQIIAAPKRLSDALWPTSTQSIPPLFDNDSAYVYFEPDAAVRPKPPGLHQHQQINMNVDDSSSEDEKFTVNSNSTRTSYNPSVLHLDHDARNIESAL